MQKDQLSWFLSIDFRPSFRHKLSFSNSNAGSWQRCAILTLKPSKPWMHHPPLTARRKYSIGVCISWAVWPTLNTHTGPAQSIQGRWTRGRRLQVMQKQQCPSCGCLLDGNLPSLVPTRTFTWSDRPVCCVIDGRRLSTNDSLSESQQDGHRSSRPLCSARLCQHQLKGGIFNPNTCLTKSTADCKQSGSRTLTHFGRQKSIYSAPFSFFVQICAGTNSQGCVWGRRLLRKMHTSSFNLFFVSNDKKD